MKASPPPAPTSRLATLHLAVLEDDEALREAILLPGLRDYGFEVTGAATAAELYRHMLRQRFDIVVLDIGLPDEDGVTVARHLRELSDVGIVMLTGNRGRRDHLRALDVGADAYLTKPVDLDVLAATLRSLHRRLDASPATANDDTSARWHLDTGGWCLAAPNGASLTLTAPERQLLAALIEANGQSVSRETLIAALSSNVYDFDPHRLEMLVYRLRRKSIDAGAGPLPLLTSRGEGYLFVCEDRAHPRPPGAGHG
jgi:DNA-binding response OmpR family regulator